MIKERRVILRAEGLFVGDMAGLAPLSDHRLVASDLSPRAGFDIASLRAEVAEVTHLQMREIERDPQVVGHVADMPFCHVQAEGPTAPGGDAVPPRASWGIAAVGAEALNNLAGRGVRVAVLDTGIDTTHPAFRQFDFFGCFEDFTGTGLADDVGHGTHCAGTIFGADVETVSAGQTVTTRIGIARGIEQPLIAKVLSRYGGSTESVMRGALWAMQRGTHIACMSLGIDFARVVDRHLAQGMAPAPAYGRALAAYRENLLVFDRLAMLSGLPSGPTMPLFVAASGNSSNRDEYTVPTEPPAASPVILSVAALRPDLQVWSGSNDYPELSAPGVDIWSALRGGGVAPSTGTSMAAPHVAGVAAVIAEEMVARGQFNGAELRRRVLDHTRPIPGVSRRDGGLGLSVVA